MMTQLQLETDDTITAISLKLKLTIICFVRNADENWDSLHNVVLVRDVDSTLVKHLHQLYLEFLMLSILNYSQEKHRRERETKSHIKFDMEREEVNGT